MFISINYSFKTWIFCCNNFALSWVDKVITETESFVSVIENVVPWFVTSVKTITQFADQVKNEINFTIN